VEIHLGVEVKTEGAFVWASSAGEQGQKPRFISFNQISIWDNVFQPFTQFDYVILMVYLVVA
jgi:hypothetical protein